MALEKTCANCSKKFRIIDQEKEFLEKNSWPLPTECPDCRQDRRMGMRNPRKLHKTTCDKDGEEIIVTFEREKDDIVYCKKHFLEWYQSSDHLVDENGEVK